MIRIESGNAVKFSYGDTFLLTATLVGYTTSAGDVATLAIKETADNTAVKMAITGAISQSGSDTVVVFQKSADDMVLLPVGNYVYDISVVNSGGRTTFMFTAEFNVKAVAHNV